MNKHLLKIEGLKTVSAQFPNSKRSYTYYLTGPVEPGQHFIVQTPKRWSSVVITDVHETPQIDQNAKFVYKKLEHKVRVTQDANVFTAFADQLSIKAEGPTYLFAISNLVNKFEMIFPTQTEDDYAEQ